MIARLQAWFVTSALALSLGAVLGAGALALWERHAPFGLGLAQKLEKAKAAPVKERLKVVERVVYRQAEAAKITEDVGRRVAEREAEVRTVTRTIIERVPIYVTPEADRSSPVPLGFARLHDAAALGAPAVPFGPGESPDSPSGVALSAVATTVAGNYGQCHVWREQVIGWQGWYAEQKALWDKP